MLSFDTDVFTLLLYYWNKLHYHVLNEFWAKTGVGVSTRFVPIHVLAFQIVQGLCQMLPALHTLTECNYSSKFGTKRDAHMANPEQYLKDFGSKPTNIDDTRVSHKVSKEVYNFYNY